MLEWSAEKSIHKTLHLKVPLGSVLKKTFEWHAFILQMIIPYNLYEH